MVKKGLAEHDLPDGPLMAAANGEPLPWCVDGLFVYGTLLRDESRFPILEPFGLECILLAFAQGRLVDMGAFPGLLTATSNDDLVRGEFLRLRDVGGALVRLDRVEGFNGFGSAGSLYRRSLIDVDAGHGRIRKAWTYRLAEQPWNARMIPSGCWRKRRGTGDGKSLSPGTVSDRPRGRLSD